MTAARTFLTHLCFLVKSHNPLVRNLKLTFNQEDFEMKKLLLNIMVVLSRDLAALQVRRTHDRATLILILQTPFLLLWDTKRDVCSKIKYMLNICGKQ